MDKYKLYNGLHILCDIEFGDYTGMHITHSIFLLNLNGWDQFQPQTFVGGLTFMGRIDLLKLSSLWDMFRFITGGCPPVQLDDQLLAKLAVKWTLLSVINKKHHW